jgi:hypothetical protein
MFWYDEGISFSFTVVPARVQAQGGADFSPWCQRGCKHKDGADFSPVNTWVVDSLTPGSRPEDVVPLSACAQSAPRRGEQKPSWRSKYSRTDDTSDERHIAPSSPMHGRWVARGAGACRRRRRRWLTWASKDFSPGSDFLRGPGGGCRPPDSNLLAVWFSQTHHGTKDQKIKSPFPRSLPSKVLQKRWP